MKSLQLAIISAIIFVFSSAAFATPRKIVQYEDTAVPGITGIALSDDHVLFRLVFSDGYEPEGNLANACSAETQQFNALPLLPGDRVILNFSVSKWFVGNDGILLHALATDGTMWFLVFDEPQYMWISSKNASLSWHRMLATLPDAP